MDSGTLDGWGQGGVLAADLADCPRVVGGGAAQDPGGMRCLLLQAWPGCELQARPGCSLRSDSLRRLPHVEFGYTTEGCPSALPCTAASHLYSIMLHTWASSQTVWHRVKHRSHCSPGRRQRRPSRTRTPTLRWGGRQQALLRVACTPGLQHMSKETRVGFRWDRWAGIVHTKEYSRMDDEHSDASSQPLLLDASCEGGLSHMYELKHGYECSR